MKDEADEYMPFENNEIVDEVGCIDELQLVLNRMGLGNLDIEDIDELHKMVSFLQHVIFEVTYLYSKVLLEKGYGHYKDMSEIIKEATEKVRQDYIENCGYL